MRASKKESEIYVKRIYFWYKRISITKLASKFSSLSLILCTPIYTYFVFSIMHTIVRTSDIKNLFKHFLAPAVKYRQKNVAQKFVANGIYGIWCLSSHNFLLLYAAAAADAEKEVKLFVISPWQILFRILSAASSPSCVSGVEKVTQTRKYIKKAAAARCYSRWAEKRDFLLLLFCKSALL